jgi:hypothetical protein
MSIQDQLVEAGIRAFRRRQQRFGDESDRKMLEALVDDNGGRLVLDSRYNICIVREPEPAPEPEKKLTKAQLLRIRTIQ